MHSFRYKDYYLQGSFFVVFIVFVAFLLLFLCSFNKGNLAKPILVIAIDQPHLKQPVKPFLLLIRSNTKFRIGCSIILNVILSNTSITRKLLSPQFKSPSS